jgi:hypothetical protein
MYNGWQGAGAALFVLFPFSYQTLSVIGAIGHLLVTVLLLGSLLLWYEGRRQDSSLLLGLSIAAAILLERHRLNPAELRAGVLRRVPGGEP